ncbi:hypothetical protein CWATWH0005_4174 [Crocosphaera watsonii WH 0005]|uniref:Uncharacterized protein n=1 Tax=Crocosphaera watsonii WH 0005 TaxID=423472 RepID=T2IXY8_CROWT|nr:hypothetical protein CWATWH0005_4174 [Crocosphaera watsonii WH 0005]
MVTDGEVCLTVGVDGREAVLTGLGTGLGVGRTATVSVRGGGGVETALIGCSGSVETKFVSGGCSCCSNGSSIAFKRLNSLS